MDKGKDDGRNKSLLQNKLAWKNISVSKAWSSLHLNKTIVLQMLKGGLPPVIVLSLYQAPSVAEIEFTVGYIAVILTVSSQCLLPRAKFMKIMLFLVLSTCFGAALSCVVVLCSVSARQHTTPANASQFVKEGYNSSASAVSAIWLLLTIWLANALRAHRPGELQDPMVALSIFSSVTMTNAASFVTISEGLEFVRRLLLTFLIGLAVATGVSLFILPITSRKNMFNVLNGYPETIERFFNAQIVFVREQKSRMAVNAGAKFDQTNEETISSALTTLHGLKSKLDADLYYTKIEMAYGKLLSEDLNTIHNHLRYLDLSLAGLSMFPEVHREVLTHLSATCAANAVYGTTDSAHESSWEALMTGLEKRLASTADLATTGLKVAFDMLEIPVARFSIFSPRRKSSDTENQDGNPTRDCAKSLANLQREFDQYDDRRRNLHKIWPSLMSTENQALGEPGENSSGHEVSEHLRVFLFMEYIQNEILRAVHGLLTFANTKVSSGSMQRKRLILPAYGHSRLMNLLKHESPNAAALNTLSSWNTRSLTARDAEHLLPTNFLERSGDFLRVIPRLITSLESDFGFRVALASFTVAILAYLRQTQEFFTAQRLIWIMIVIVIGMKPESGASIFGFLARVISTTVSLILSLIVWYIVDGHTAGVLVFLYFANVFEYYFWVRFPQFLGPCTIAIVTLNVIVAYELQVKQLGIEAATSTGQPYYPIYLFGPYKLLCVIIGVTISFFWTVFPFPVSARSRARKMFSRCFFVLANFYNCTFTSIKIWINKEQGDMKDLASPGRQMQASSRALFSEEMALLAETQSLVHWTTFEPPLGGKFPKKIYRSAVSNMQVIATCMALTANATRDVDLSLPVSSLADSEQKSTGMEERWIHQLVGVSNSPDFNSHVTTALLCHLSGAISNNSALPPSLSPREPFPLAQKLREISARAMCIENIQDPTFSAFACTEMMMSLVSSRLKDLVEDVKSLVGEINFDTYVQYKGIEQSVKKRVT